MEIKTKYNIGDRVWIIYEPSFYNQQEKDYTLTGEVALYDTKIVNIIITENEINYACDDENYTEIKEEDIILYEDRKALLNKIEEVMEIINKRENRNLQSI